MHVLDYDGYLLDLDGTVYRGNEVIPEAVIFVNWLIKEQKKFLFVTNNSSKTPEQAVDRLNSMSIPAKREHIFTSALMVAHHVQQMTDRPKSAYIIGSTGLKVALEEVGLIEQDVDPDVVIVGIDRTFTYDKLEKASLAIQKGAKFIATNGDKMIPTERGFVPGNGSIIAAIEVASGKEALVMGKPNPMFIKQAAEIISTPHQKTIMIGDNYDTDISAGIAAGVDTLHVDTGVTRNTVVKKKAIQPTFSIRTFKDIM
ncbi:TIGR01457 family HAD-type hydrolase [Geomicrobium sediminis]|uniref:Acid sugar phosphatase n=1 Tax=Geomicrobium sediminis TaxID=1347788 RepID=A0ABS2P9C4_9BACL|nr:TIGR01457 family HAD-type hydrolase [Geomicrobium sediminis]MBM7632000.1 4-nitrophenyl phosphatase [Geomicrobium sediminis]